MRLKVLMTADTVGGVWTYALELSRALGRYGVDVALCTMGKTPLPEQLDEALSIQNLELYPSSYKLEWMDDPWDDVERAGRWLLHMAERIRPDLVQLNGYAHGSLKWDLPVLMVGHSCVLSWWEAVKGESAPEEWERYRIEVTQGLRSANLVLAPTHAMLCALDKHYGPLGVTGVVHNGRDPEQFHIEEKKPIIFAAGRVWDEAKNISSLEEAAEGIEWPVYVAGDDEHPSGWSAEHRNVRLLGRLAPHVLPYWYARASIYVLPARYEPFGLSALEAALAGCALVLGDIPSLREVWGDTALFVPPDDVDAIRTIVNMLIGDEQMRIDLAAKSHARALEYTPERMAQGYLSAYCDLLGKQELVRDLSIL